MTPGTISEHPYAFIALYVAVAAAFPVVLLAVTWLWARFFQPPKPNALKNSTYECGLESSGPGRIHIKPHYYLYAILFLVFDVEVLFLLPFATVASGVSAAAIFVMLVFILLLAEGLVWAWARGHLEWR